MTDSATPSRALTPPEIDELKSSLKSHLRLHNSPCAFQAEADADDLLNYALDMIEDGNNVNSVCEELNFMEMSICDEEVLEEVRHGKFCRMGYRIARANGCKNMYSQSLLGVVLCICY